jgi:hypothetical protein
LLVKSIRFPVGKTQVSFNKNGKEMVGWRRYNLGRLEINYFLKTIYNPIGRFSEVRILSFKSLLLYFHGAGITPDF